MTINYLSPLALHPYRCKQGAKRGKKSGANHPSMNDNSTYQTVTVNGVKLVHDDDLGYYVPEPIYLERQALLVERVEEKMTAEKTENGELVLTRSKVVTAVRVDEMRDLAAAERHKFVKEIYGHARYLGNVVCVLGTLILIIGGIAVLRAIWEKKDIIAELGASAIGTVLQWFIYIFGFTVLALFFMAMSRSFRTSTAFDFSSDEEPVYGSKRRSGSGTSNGGAAQEKTVVNNVIVNIGGDFSGNTSDAQAIVNQR